MLKYFFTLVGIIFAGIIGFLAHYQPGKLTLSYNQSLVEVPLWLAFLLMLGFIVIVFLIYAIVDKICRGWQWLGYRLRHWREARLQKEQLALAHFLQNLSDATQRAGTSLEPIEALWSQAPRNFRYHPEALLLYAETLKNHGQAERAEAVLREGLDKVWYDSWVRLYGLVQIPEMNTQLKKSEKWLNRHPTNAVLLLTLGRLSIRNQLWGKAKEYLEKSINIAPSAEAYAELGRLHEFLGDFAGGESWYKQGIFAVIGEDFVAYPTAIPTELKPARSFFNRLLGSNKNNATEKTQNNSLTYRE